MYQYGVLAQNILLPADEHHFSLVYGVNCCALLNTLDFFSITPDALIPDTVYNEIFVVKVFCVLNFLAFNFRGSSYIAISHSSNYYW